jgi:hypothetical protein
VTRYFNPLATRSLSPFKTLQDPRRPGFLEGFLLRAARASNGLHRAGEALAQGGSPIGEPVDTHIEITWDCDHCGRRHRDALMLEECANWPPTRETCWGGQRKTWQDAQERNSPEKPS